MSEKNLMEGATKVKDLIGYLKQLDQDAYVILSSDSEGNSFSPIVLEHGEGLYIPDNTWSGEWSNPEDPDAYRNPGNEYKAVFLFPTN